MKFFGIKAYGSLHPVGEASIAEFETLKSNTEYEIVVTKKRNLQFHKKFFALIKFGHIHTDLIMPIDDYRSYCIMKAGFFKSYATDKGTLFLPESISFANMDDIEFEIVYKKVFDVVCKDIDTDDDDLMNELASFI